MQSKMCLDIVDTTARDIYVYGFLTPLSLE